MDSAWRRGAGWAGGAAARSWRGLSARAAGPVARGEAALAAGARAALERCGEASGAAGGALRGARKPAALGGSGGTPGGWRGFAAGTTSTSSGFGDYAGPGQGVVIPPGAPVPPGGLLQLNTLRDVPKARRTAKRVGRGMGSGKGKTAGKGHKGQKARSGRGPHPLFEGGQTPLRVRLPKRGFTNPNAVEWDWLNLSQLQSWIDQGRLDPSRVITMKELRDSGAVTHTIDHGVKLLAKGADTFTAQGVRLEVSRASAAARAAVEANGGTVTTVYYNRLGLRALFKPHKFPLGLPKPARPPPRLAGRTDAVGTLPGGLASSSSSAA